jgi:hypothetical protein
MAKNFRNQSSLSGHFFHVTYHQNQGMFLPVGDIGADGWTLGFGYPWYPTTDLAHEGWQHILKKAQWHAPASDQSYASNSILGGCCGVNSLPVSNAFIPLLAVQVEGRESPTAQKLFRWLEAKFGRAVDTDGDGHPESYYYHTDDKLRIVATGAIATALATDGDSLRRLFSSSRREILSAPTLARVDYPRVFVRSAEYRAPVLRFAVLKGVPNFTGSTKIVCTQLGDKAQVQRDGEPFTDFRQEGSTVVIHTDLDREHVFEVRAERPADPGAGSPK